MGPRMLEEHPIVLFEDLSRHHLVLPGKTDQLDMIPIDHSVSSVGGILSSMSVK